MLLVATEIPEPVDTYEGTITAIRPMRCRASVQVTLNRRVRVVVSRGMSEFFAGLRVRMSGVWRKGTRGR
ncbi:MAG: hypothetical protein OJF50_006479 [Nitrospira sp.]|jgi:hypothetical protein|nr:hypothetical protein [Nitrospira sp.]